MRLELTRVGLQVELANHYTTRGAFANVPGCDIAVNKFDLKSRNNVHFRTNILVGGSNG